MGRARGKPTGNGTAPSFYSIAPDTGERGWCVAEAALYRSPVQVKRSVRPCGREADLQDKKGHPPHDRDGPKSETGQDKKPRRPRPKTGTIQDKRPRQAQTKDRDSSRRFGGPLSPTPDPASPALGHRAWGGTGQGRGPVWGLTQRWRRRATAYIVWPAWGCTMWPAPQLGR